MGPAIDLEEKMDRIKKEIEFTEPNKKKSRNKMTHLKPKKKKRK